MFIDLQLIPSCHSFVSKSSRFAESKPFPKSIRADSVRLLEPTEVDREKKPEHLLKP